MTLSNLRGLHDPVRTEREAVLEAELSKARQTVRFFASVIKSGEPWTPACEEAMSAALSTTASREKFDA